jgi:hypothetical protein
VSLILLFWTAKPTGTEYKNVRTTLVWRDAVQWFVDGRWAAILLEKVDRNGLCMRMSESFCFAWLAYLTLDLTIFFITCHRVLTVLVRRGWRCRKKAGVGEVTVPLLQVATMTAIRELMISTSVITSSYTKWQHNIPWFERLQTYPRPYL